MRTEEDIKNELEFTEEDIEELRRSTLRSSSSSFRLTEKKIIKGVLMWVLGDDTEYYSASEIRKKMMS